MYHTYSVTLIGVLWHPHDDEAGLLWISDRSCPPSPVASGDDDLRGLGVSVYNQDEFEAGVLQQIDTEVKRRNKEQVRGFLVKEYNSVQSELKWV